MDRRSLRLLVLLTAAAGALALTLPSTARPTSAAAVPDVTGHWGGAATSTPTQHVTFLSADLTGSTTSKTFTGTLESNPGVAINYNVKGKVTSGGAVTATLTPITPHAKKVTLKGTLSPSGSNTALSGTYKTAGDHGTFSIAR